MITTHYMTDTYRGYQLRINRNGEVSIFAKPFSSRRDKAGDWDHISDEYSRADAEAMIDHWLEAR